MCSINIQLHDVPCELFGFYFKVNRPRNSLDCTMCVVRGWTDSGILMLLIDMLKMGCVMEEVTRFKMGLNRHGLMHAIIQPPS